MRVHIIMKRTYLSWMTTVLMAFACVAFISCDKDDDKEGGGGTTGGNFSAGSASFSVNYGFYDSEVEGGEKNWQLFFYNFDANSASIPQSVNEVIIYFSVPKSVEGIPVGTFNAFGVNVCKGENLFVEEETGEYYSGYADGKKTKVDLNIAKNGDNYTVSFEGLSISEDDGDEEISASFSYTGKLTQMQYEEQ